MSTDRPSNIVNVQDVSPVHTDVKNYFASERRALGRAAGGVQIGASHMRVPPGKTAWPSHFHAANEEAIFISRGAGHPAPGGPAAPG